MVLNIYIQSFYKKGMTALIYADENKKLFKIDTNIYFESLNGKYNK